MHNGWGAHGHITAMINSTWNLENGYVCRNCSPSFAEMKEMQQQQTELEQGCVWVFCKLCLFNVPAVQRGAVPSYGERRQPPLQLPEAWSRRDVGTQQVPTVHVPEITKIKASCEQAWIIHESTKVQVAEDYLTVCYTGSTCLCPSHSCLSPSPQYWASRNRTYHPPSPLKEKTHVPTIRSWFWCFLVQHLTCTEEYWTYSRPRGTCTVYLWFYTFHWSSDPEERSIWVTKSLHLCSSSSSKGHSASELTWSFSHV